MKQKRVSSLLFSCFFLGVLVLFFTGLSNVDKSKGEEGKQLLEHSVRRAAVACYAAEGRYPPDLDYLKSHYGLQIDEGHYTVYYDAFAENLMPDITVLEQGHD